MQIDSIELQPLSTSLFDFVWHEIRPLGQVSLSLSLGEVRLRRIHTTIFTMVEATSAYNVILGRPPMSTFKTMASTYH